MAFFYLKNIMIGRIKRYPVLGEVEIVHAVPLARAWDIACKPGEVQDIITKHAAVAKPTE